MSDTASPPPPLDDATVEAIVDAMTPLLGLSIEAAWRDAIGLNLKAVAAASRLVLDFPLDELEPAPVFRA